MLNELLNKVTSKDYLLMFSSLGISKLLKKEDFRITSQDILIREEVLPKEDEYNFLSNDIEILWGSLRLILQNIKGELTISFINLSLPYKYIIDKPNCYGYYLQPADMYKPLDIRLINKIEVFDSNGAYKDSWTRSVSTPTYTEVQQEYITLIEENYDSEFNINSLYKGYLQLNPNNLSELLILNNKEDIGNPPESIAFYQIIKIDSITSLNII